MTVVKQRKNIVTNIIRQAAGEQQLRINLHSVDTHPEVRSSSSSSSRSVSGLLEKGPGRIRRGWGRRQGRHSVDTRMCMRWRGWEVGGNP